jgi:N-methylhydantoinase A
MLAHGELAGGVRLDVEKARAALAPVAEKLGFTVEDAACGVLTIVTANMANAIREITVEQGQDPRRTTLVPFGGAGPLFATMLARELEIRKIVIPPYAGNFSAWGLLGSDLTRTAARTRIMKLSDEAIADTNNVLEVLFAEIEGRAASDGSVQSREVDLDMRYVGQEHTLTIALPSECGRITIGPLTVRDKFRVEYQRTFGHVMEEPIEIVSIRATLRTPLPRRAEEHVVGTAASQRRVMHSIDAYSFTRGTRLPFAVLDRSTLAAEAVVDGPAIILEETATTYLDAGYWARVHPSGSLFVSDTSGAT